jgi:hypothetical protein
MRPAQALSGDALLVDPSPDELARSDGAATVASLPAAGALTYVAHAGALSGDAAAEAAEAALDACAVLDQALRAALAADAAPHARAALAQRDAQLTQHAAAAY